MRGVLGRRIRDERKRSGVGDSRAVGVRAVNW
jgi:hypothetical protein